MENTEKYAIVTNVLINVIYNTGRTIFKKMNFKLEKVSYSRDA